jgi:hypothetical protein
MHCEQQPLLGRFRHVHERQLQCFQLRPERTELLQRRDLYGALHRVRPDPSLRSVRLRRVPLLCQLLVWWGVRLQHGNHAVPMIDGLLLTASCT